MKTEKYKGWDIKNTYHPYGYNATLKISGETFSLFEKTLTAIKSSIDLKEVLMKTQKPKQKEAYDYKGWTITNCRKFSEQFQAGKDGVKVSFMAESEKEIREYIDFHEENTNKNCSWVANVEIGFDSQIPLSDNEAHQILQNLLDKLSKQTEEDNFELDFSLKKIITNDEYWKNIKDTEE